MLSPDQISQIASSRGDSVVNPSAGAAASPGQSAADAYAKRVGFTPSPSSTGPKNDMDVLGEIGGGIKNDFQKRNANVAQIKADVEGGKKSLLSGLFESGGQVAGLVGDAAMDVVKPAIKPEVKDAVKGAIGAVAQTPPAQALTKAWGDFKVAHPEIAGNIEATGNIAQLLPVLKGPGEVLKLAGAGTEASGKLAAEIGTKAASGVKTGAKATVGKVLPKAVNPAEQAMKDVVPDFKSATPTEKSKMINSSVNGKPRVNEGTALGERTVTPNKLEQDAAKELQKVPGYNPKDTNLVKFNTVKTEIAARGKALEKSLEGEKVVVPKRELYSKVKVAIDAVPEESLLLQTSDPAITNYTRVLQNALSKEPGNLKGVLNIRKALDDAYENARGRLAYDDARSVALDEVHTAARDAMYNYLIDNAVETDVKASLKSQWDLFRAADVLRAKAVKEAGTGIGRLMEANPKTTSVVKGAAKFTGLGAGLHLLP